MVWTPKESKRIGRIPGLFVSLGVAFDALCSTRLAFKRVGQKPKGFLVPLTLYLISVHLSSVTRCWAWFKPVEMGLAAIFTYCIAPLCLDEIHGRVAE